MAMLEGMRWREPVTGYERPWSGSVN